MNRERNFGVGSTLTHKGVRIRIELIPDEWSNYHRTILRDSLTTKDLSEEKFNLIKAKQILKEEELETD